MDQFSVAVVISFAAVGVILVLIAIIRWRREKQLADLESRIAAHVFNEPLVEVMPNLDERIRHLEENGSQNPEIEVMQIRQGYEPPTEWLDGGVAYTDANGDTVPIPESRPGNDSDFKMHKLQCGNCGGQLVLENGRRLARCEACDTQYYLENLELEGFMQDRHYSSQPYFLEDGWRRPDYG